MSADLKYFTQTPILRQIGHRRLAKLLSAFESDLKACAVVLPEPDPQSVDYFADLANALATQRLPHSLHKALLTIENAASPENDKPLWSSIGRRIPGVSVSHDCAVDRALDLWFLAPDEMAQFAPVFYSVSEGGPVQPRIHTDEHGLITQADGAISPKSDPTVSNGISVNPCPSTLRSSSEPATEDGSVVTPSGIDAPTSSDDQTFARLAHLSPAQYDRLRHAEAARLGIRLETLDTEVARCRFDVDAEAHAVKLPRIEPWPEPVKGDELMHQVCARYALFVVMQPGAPHAVTLWNAHAHAFSAFLHTPRLNLCSPKSQCGKTTTLDILATMTPRALRMENLTAPVLFRLVAQHQPTLLLDEVDTYLINSDELRGLLNAGHKQGACAYRCEGVGNAVRAFNAFGPAVLSGIGDLPETLHDRSIRILLLPAEPEQVIAHFDSRHHEIEDVLCRKLVRWTQDNFAALRTCDPPMPAGAYNRVADNWRPLFAIAHTVGGDWPRLAIEAYEHLTAQRIINVTPQLSTKNSQLSEGRAIFLLADIRQIFARSGWTRMTSKQLVEALRALSVGNSCADSGAERQGAVASYSDLNPTSLGRRLRRLGICSHNIRAAGLRAKGYELCDFTGALTRLAGTTPQSQPSPDTFEI